MMLEKTPQNKTYRKPASITGIIRPQKATGGGSFSTLDGEPLQPDSAMMDFMKERSRFAYRLYEEGAGRPEKIARALSLFKNLYGYAQQIENSPRETLLSLKFMVGVCLYESAGSVTDYPKILEGLRYIRETSALGSQPAMDYLRKHDSHYTVPGILSRFITNKQELRDFLKNPRAYLQAYKALLDDIRQSEAI